VFDRREIQTISIANHESAQHLASRGKHLAAEKVLQCSVRLRFPE
jgi:hypothetical protein